MDSLPGGAHDRVWVLYLRKSKGKAGISRQRHACQALLPELGGTIIKEFVDVDTTAFKKVGATQRPRRDAYQAMLAFLRNEAGNRRVGILSMHADRLHRYQGEIEAFVEVCAAGRHLVQTARSGSYELWTPTGRKRIWDDANTAAFEVDQLQDRIQAHKDEAAREGRPLGGPAPFGWKWTRVNLEDERRSLVIVPEVADALRWGADAVLRGVPLVEIGREWNRRGVYRSSGKPWEGAHGISYMLQHPRNAGFLVHRGKIVETQLPGGHAAWEPILTEEMWRAVVNVLSDPARRPNKRQAPRWLGSGLYVCGIEGCGTTLSSSSVGEVKDGRPWRRPIYRCRVKGRHVTRDAATLDAFVREVLTRRLCKPDFLTLLAEDDAPDLEGLQRKLTVEQAELATWRRLARERKVTALAFAESEQAVLAEIDRIKGEIVAAFPDPALVELAGVEDIAAFCAAKQDDLVWWRSILRGLVTVVVEPPAQGRPPGWKVGDPYFHPAAIKFHWKKKGLAAG